MKKIVVDLNVVLDVLGKRPGHEEAVKLFDLCVTRKVKGYLCVSDVTALAQFLFKKLKRGPNARSVLTDVLDVFTTIPATESSITSFTNSRRSSRPFCEKISVARWVRSRNRIPCSM